jgi:hypothetical protein
MRRVFVFGVVALALVGCAVLTSLDDLHGGDASTTDGAVDASIESGADDVLVDAPIDSPPPVDGSGPFAPAILQGFGNWVFGSQSSVTVTSPNPQTKGALNLVVVSFQTDGAQSAVLSITDTDGNAYVACVPASYSTQSTPANVVGQTVWLAKNIKGGSSPNKITVTSIFDTGSDAGAGDQDIRVVEITGLDPNAPFVASNQHSGSGTTDTTNSVVTSSPSLLVAAGVLEYSAPYVDAAAPFALIPTPTSAVFGIVEYQVTDAGGTFGASAYSTQANYLMQLVALH